MKEKVIIGLSGGVDSSVSALLLKDKGYDVTGFTLIPDKKWESVNMPFIKAVTEKIGIPNIVFDASEIFTEKIINPYLAALHTKETPSPCPLCNESVKFRLLNEYANELHCSYIATGHYADVAEINGYPILKRHCEFMKDQSYMLYRLGSDILRKLIFPVSGISKKRIREIARENNLINMERPDSQGLCFQPKGYREFIKTNIQQNEKQGFFCDVNGNRIKTNEGHWYYSIGQRKGLEFAHNDKLFVIDKNPEENSVIVGEYRHLMSDTILLRDCRINEYYADVLGDLELTARPRYSSRGNPAKVSVNGSGMIVSFLSPNAESTPGQHMVLYHEDKIAGGGIITSVSLTER